MGGLDLILYAALVGRSVAQPGSAFGSGPKGRGFKSLHSDHPSKPHPWWNWQTRKIQVLMLRDVWVRVPPGAPKRLLRPHRLSARTQGSHPWKSGPTPLGGAIRANILGPHRLSARTQGSHPWKSGPTPLGGAIRRGGRVPQGTGGSNPSLSASLSAHVFRIGWQTRPQGALFSSSGPARRRRRPGRGRGTRRPRGVRGRCGGRRDRRFAWRRGGGRDLPAGRQGCRPAR